MQKSNVFDYNLLVEQALRGVVAEALKRANETGLPGNHHFFISFRTDFPGVEMANYLRGRYPDDMTIVLQHQFWGLEPGKDGFAVTLSFNKVPERLYIPYAAVTSFADPSVQFGLQFRAQPEASTSMSASPKVARSGTGGMPAAGNAQGNAHQGNTPGTAIGATERKDAVPAAGADAPAADAQADAAEKKAGEVVALDTFRKKR